MSLLSDPATRHHAYRELFGSQIKPDLIHAIADALTQGTGPRAR